MGNLKRNSRMVFKNSSKIGDSKEEPQKLEMNKIHNIIVLSQNHNNFVEKYLIFEVFSSNFNIKRKIIWFINSSLLY